MSAAKIGASSRASDTPTSPPTAFCCLKNGQGGQRRLGGDGAREQADQADDGQRFDPDEPHLLDDETEAKRAPEGAGESLDQQQGARPHINERGRQAAPDHLRCRAGAPGTDRRPPPPLDVSISHVGSPDHLLPMKRARSRTKRARPSRATTHATHPFTVDGGHVGPGAKRGRSQAGVDLNATLIHRLGPRSVRGSVRSRCEDRCQEGKERAMAMSLARRWWIWQSAGRPRSRLAS